MNKSNKKNIEITQTPSVVQYIRETHQKLSYKSIKINAFLINITHFNERKRKQELNIITYY